MADSPTAPEALAAALDAHNRWRRDDDGIEPAPNPTELGKTIDAAAAMLRTLRARVAELEAEAREWRKHCDTLTHQVICCGVAASHPDATLTTHGAYAGKWNSRQAEEVRALRAERDALKAERAAGVPADVREVMQRMVKGIDHLADLARLWEPDYSSGSDRRGWVLAKDARDDALRLLAAAPTPTGDAPTLPADAGGEG